MDNFYDQYKSLNDLRIEKNKILTKPHNNLKEINNSNNQLYLRKNYNINEFQQYRPMKNKKENENYNENAELETKSELKYKYRITRLNIDSRYRNTIPKNILSKNSSLLNNPFNLQKNSNIITINLPNHNFTIDDKIIIENVIGHITYLSYLELSKESYFIKINHLNHNMIPTNQYSILISDLTYNNSTYISNIPLNSINDYHLVYFNTDNSNNYDPNYYFIKIELKANENIIYDNLYFKITYQHLYGIPLNNINANYPINSNRNNGYHIINSIINNNQFTIKVENVASNNINNCGGNNIIINKIIDYIEGYPDNNNYIISLNKTFYNVDKIKLISTEFPNTDKIIKDFPESKRNNKLYWQILGDGDNIYNIDITPGNYSVATLQTEISNQIGKTVMNLINKTNSINYQYSNTFYSDINIDVNTNIFNITFYGQITIKDPFKISVDNVDSTLYYIEVNHPNHLLQEGTQIIIINSLDIGKVSGSVINGVQTIKTIIDKDKYLIQLAKFNILSTSNEDIAGGGNAVQIRYPFISRLLFNKPGTIGNIIGFRNIGQFDSITKWNYKISNNDPYYNDILVDSVGKQINNSIINNYINLNGDNYILMANPLFKNTVDTGSINGIFAKILLAGPPGYILFNQYIQLGEELIEGVQSLSELQFSFWSPDGSLYYFNNIDHSFTIEIYEKILDTNFI